MDERDGTAQTYLRLLAAFWATFGSITTFVPQVMELFMTDEGKDAGTAFSDNVWLHDGLDILAVALLLWVLGDATGLGEDTARRGGRRAGAGPRDRLQPDCDGLPRGALRRPARRELGVLGLRIHARTATAAPGVAPA